MFDGLAALRELDLSRNDLTTLPDDVFEPLTALTTLYLSGNPGAPFAPEAVALPDDGTVSNGGGTVTLDGSGSGSGGPWGTNVTYGWALTDPASGVTVTFDDAASATPVVTIPALATDPELTFTLTVTGRGGTDGIAPATDTATVTAMLDPTLGICGRTLQVRDALVAQISGVSHCADVTASHLAAITGTLSLNNAGITALAAGDFDGLTGLARLFLANNALTRLPDGVFDGLTSLSELYLTNNALTSLPDDVFDGLTSLEQLHLNDNDLPTLPDDVFQPLTALTRVNLSGNPGAPFAPEAVALPDDGMVSAAGGMVTLDGSGSDGGPWGTNVTYGWALTAPVSGVTVTFDDAASATPVVTIPALARNTGLTFTLTVTGRGGTDGIAPATDAATVTVDPGICGRTLQVRNGLVALIPGASNCADVTASHLAAITGTLTLSNVGLAALAAGDFDGLTALRTLRLERNQLATLPDDVFEPLTSLEVLFLHSNALTTLDAEVFDELTSLDLLYLQNNQLSTLPDDVFEPLTSLTSLILRDNPGAPFAPEAVALPDDGMVSAAGGMVTLDGSGSDGGPWGTNVTYGWALTDPVSGVTVTFDDAASATTEVTIPALTEGTVLTFTLTVAGRGGRAGIAPATAPATVTVDPGICGRTLQVRNGLLALIPGVSHCADVTAPDLAAITGTLTLNSVGITALAAGDFDGLTSLSELHLENNRLTTLPDDVFQPLTALTRLYLQNNQLTTLDDDVFEPLTALTGLYLFNNALATLPDGVFDGLTSLMELSLIYNQLTTLDDDVFQPLTALTTLALRENPGAPFAPEAVALPDDGTVSNGGGTVTLDGSGSGGPWGTNVTYGWALTDPASGVTVTFDDAASATPVVTIPALATDPELTFTLTVTGRGGTDGIAPATDTATVTAMLDPTLGICGRTLQVRDALVAQISGVSHCADVTAPHLAAITGTLLLSGENITALAAGDFEGLTALTSLDLSRNGLTALPADVFNGLTALTSLALNRNGLTALPADVFEGLTALTSLDLSFNDLATLDGDVFDGLTLLEQLYLGENDLATLPADVFDGLTSLEGLHLSYNDLATLLADVFDGLTALTDLSLSANDLTTLPDDVFDGLTALTDLSLSANDLPTLPANVFDGLTALTDLALSGNPGAPFAPEAVALPDDGTVSNGGGTVTLDGSGSGSGGPWGTNVTYGWALTDPASGVTVTFDDAASAMPVVTIPALATGTGLTFTLTVTGRGGTDGIAPATDTATVTAILDPTGGICGRPLQVRDALVALIPSVSHCADVTATHLAAITGTLTLNSVGLTALAAGDFDGLTSLRRLFLADNALATLPEGVFDGLTSLSDLLLQNNRLTTLPDDVFEPLTALRDLHLADNALATLPDGVFDGLTALMELHLQNNRLTTLPDDVFEPLTALSELHLQNNRLTTLPDDVFEPLTALSELYLQNNALATLPDGVFDGLTSLSELYLQDNQLTTLPDDVFEPLTALTRLTLRGNPGASFAPEAVALPDDGIVSSAGGMVTLDGSGSGGPWGTNVTYGWALTDPVSGVTVTFDDDTSATPVVTIPALAKDTELTFTLTVTGRGGTDGIAPATDTATVTVDPGICGRTLQVRNALVDAISGVSHCAHVTTIHLAALAGALRLTNNSITRLKAGDFDGLTSLLVLGLNDNKLTTLPDGVFDGLTSLVDLYLQNNRLTTLDDDVFEPLTSLGTLLLEGNSLTTLDAGMFAGLPGLTHLDLGSNQLTTVPDDMFDELTALTVLSLDFNHLATLDAGVFDELTALTDLSLVSNQLTTLPDDVFEPLTALTSLSLRGNPGAPFAPEAVALPDDGTVSAAGGMVTLDGSGSDGGPWGTNVTYGWGLTDPVSGVTVTFDDDTSATPEVTIPALTAGTGLTFTLTVTGRGGTDGIVPATDTATVTTISDDATLSALTVNDGTNDLTLAPPFASGTFAYAADVAHAVDEVTLSATVNHAGAAVSAVTLNGTAVADGDFTDGITVSGLLAGGNEIVVTVTAQDTSTTRTYTVTVTRAANAAPTALAASVTTDEDTAYTFAAADFNFTDSDGDALASVMVVTLPAEGALELDATVVTPGQSVPAADIGKLVFTPAANGNGAGYASFTFRVHDGKDESAASYVMTVNVTAMNDPATGAPTISGTAQVGQTLTAATTGIADVDGLTSPSYGYQWIRVDADGTSNPTDITGATLATYTPVRADVGNKLRVKVSFTDDDGSGEELTSAATATVLANTAPRALDASVTTNEDTAYTFAAADFNFTDSDGNALASVTVVTLPTEGTLTLDGPAVTTGQSVPAADIGKLVFTPAPNAHGDAHARFTFRVHDGTDESAAAYTMTVNVTAMNDPATGAPTISGTAVVGQTLTAATLGIADVDGLTSPTYGYQWVRVDDDGTSNPTDITGATSATYKQVEADVGRKLRVTVSFTDDDGNDEELTSAATATETVLDPTVGICGRTPQVRDALVALIPVVSNCADVTATHLAAITGTLELSGQQITALAVGDFAVGDFVGLTSLTHLSLYSNALTTLPTGVFDELTALTELLLGSNQLSTLPAGVFDGLTRLETLALHNNALTMLDAGVFDGLTALRSLNLHGSKLATLSDDVFKPLTALAELLLGSNSLTTLPAEVFNGLTSLTVLRLARNDLTTLDAGVFDGLTSLTQLYLNNNELTTLDDDVFEPLTALIALTLRDNPGAPFAPDAVALPDDGTVPAAGGMVTLDGSGSDGGPWGTNVTYGWALTDPVSGVTVTFDDDTSATPEVTIPALAAGTGLTFTLTVTGRGGTDGIVPATDTATVTATASNDATLSALTVNDGTSDLTLAPVFASGTFVYAADVAHAVDEVTLSATVNHAGASVSAVTLNGTAVADSDFTDGITVSALLAGGNDIVVTVTAEDTSTTRTYTVTVTANTAPTALDALVTTNEDTAYTFGAADFNFDDTDTGDALASVTVVTLPAEGALELDGTAVTTGQSVPAADIGKLVFTPAPNGNGDAYASFTFRVHDGTDESAASYVMTVNVTAMNDPATGAPTISGAARVGQVLTADASGIADIDGLPAVSAFAYRWIRVEGGSDTEIPAATSGTYRLVAGDVAKKLKVRVSFTDLDGHAEALTSAAYPAGTQVSANTAPTASDETVTVEEDSSYRFQASDFGFADTDGDALGSVKITALPLAGTLELDATAVTTGQSVPAADIGKLVFTPAPNGNGDAYASFTFRVHDGTDESAASYVMTVNVTAMNDPATGAPTISGAARVGQVLTADASGIADIDGLPAVSAFAYRWIRVEGGSDTEIPAATSGTYRLVAGDVAKKLKVRVSFTDLDGHAEALTSAAYPAGTQVSANTAPTASDETVTVEEDSSYRFQASDFGFADTDGDALGSVKITALPLAGTLELDATAVTTGQSVPAADIGKLVFTPAPNAHGDAHASFTFRVHDGTDESAASYVMTVNVTAMNDPATGAPTISGTAQVGQTLTAATTAIADVDGLTSPSYGYQWIRVDADGTSNPTDITGATLATYTPVRADVGNKLRVTVSFTDDDSNDEELTSAATATVLANTAPRASASSVTTNEDTAHTFAAADFNFTDSDGNALASVTVVTLPAEGALELDGTPVTTGQSVPAADIGKLAFTPAPNAHGDAHASFTFRVHDGTDESASSYVMTVNVTAMNDPATGAPTISGTAQVGQTLTAATTGIADVDGLTSPSYGYQWIRVDADGTSNPTDITGATLATYTPVRADVGNKLRVTVSFTDDDSNDEERTSDAYPASGTVEAAPNAAPSFTSSATFDAAENQTVVGTVAAADGDPGDSVTGYALEGGADQSRFTIVEATGELAFTSAPNFEAATDADTNNDYVVVVRATSGTGGREKTADQTITVTVTDEDGEAPGAPATPTVSSASVSSVTVTWAAPSNAGPPITDYDYRYRVKVPQGSWTEVTTTPITGLSATITGLAENTEYEVQVRATNAEGTGDWSDPPGRGATDANAAASFTSLATFDAAENQTVVGTVAAADGDPGDSVTGYALQGGADASRFTIVEATGELTFDAAPNFEAATDADTDNDYVVVVRATSGTGGREKTADQTITVTVTDEDGEAPGAPATPTVSSASVSSVTVAWAAPSNAGPPITDYDYRYRVKTPQGSWTEVTTTPITGTGATITGLAENTEYEVQVRATNAEGTGGWSDPPGRGATDANAAPSFTSSATFDAVENQTVVGTVAASDGDPGDSVTGYALQSGADASRFTIVPSTGVLTFTSAPNFEAAADADTDNDYVVVVRATSGTGARLKTADQTITVTVTDEAGEAPGAPATPAVSSASVSSVTVAWAAPANAGPPITDYDYRYRVKAPQGSWTEVTTTPITALGRRSRGWRRTRSTRCRCGRRTPRARATGPTPRAAARRTRTRRRRSRRRRRSTWRRTSSRWGRSRRRTGTPATA